MTSALMALGYLFAALVAGEPFDPALVRDAHITVATTPGDSRYPETTQCWIDTCTVKVRAGMSSEVVTAVTEHGVCHSLDALSDGVQDGLIFGLNVWAASEVQEGDPTDDVERLGYYCQHRPRPGNEVQR